MTSAAVSTTGHSEAAAPSTAVFEPLAASMLERIACYYCGETSSTAFITAQDDLTGKPGTFCFVTCAACGLRYQNPRVTLEHIRAYYDDEYIAHRKKSDWGLLTGFFNHVMEQHDRRKDRLVRRYVTLTPDSEVLDVGCAVGTFLEFVGKRHGARTTGVDFKDLTWHPSLAHAEFHCGLFYEQDVGADRFDLVTMWHFLEHDYDPLRTLAHARAALKREGRLVIEVPRLDSLTFRLYRDRWPGLQAPQHTVLYDKAMLLKVLRKAGFEVVDYLPYGAFPPFFYVFAGAAFMMLKGKGLDLSRAITPYFMGNILFAPILAFDQHLKLAMQTVVCRRGR